MLPAQTNTESSTDVLNNQTKTSVRMPEHISLSKWEDSGFEWQGEIMPTSFERLNTLLTTEHAQTNLQLTATLNRRNNVLHLVFDLTGSIWLTCQRCLQPIDINLTDHYNIALLENESQASMMDESQDYLVLSEIVDESTPERLLPFKKLVEDELLLRTPMAPKHDDCEMAIEQYGEISEEEESENPFAALASLKGKL